MNQSNDKTNEEIIKRLDPYEETLRSIEEQLGHLTKDIYKKPQKTITSGVGINDEDTEPCWVVTLRSSKKLEAQKDEELMENKDINEEVEMQEDEGKLPKYDVTEKETSLKECFKEKSIDEQPFIENSTYKSKCLSKRRDKK